MAKTLAPWHNRIVGYGEVDPAQLLANPRNFRIHPASQQEAVGGSLDALGWIQDVVVNRPTGFVLDGHLRVNLALRYSQPTVPVKYTDLTEEEELTALSTLDPVGAMAQIEYARLSVVLDLVSTTNAGLSSLFADLQERADAALHLALSYDHAGYVAGDDLDAQSGAVRQIILVMDVAAYERMVPELRTLMRIEALPTTVTAVRFLLHRHAERAATGTEGAN